MKVIGDELLNGIEPCAATIGFFDGVHKGHQFLISQLKKVAQERGIVSAIITFPVHPRKVLNDEYQPQSISTKEEKIRLIEKSGVDYCILLPFTRDIASLSAFDFMKLLKEKYMVTALIIGYDHRFGHNRLEGFEEYCKYGKEIGIEVIQATELDNAELAVSSSAIRKLLISSDMAKANSLLGYRYSISGKVIDGYKIGRKLGYPTANISLLDDDKILPGKGVYAVYVYTDGTKRGGMLNIGTRKDSALRLNVTKISRRQEKNHMEWGEGVGMKINCLKMSKTASRKTLFAYDEAFAIGNDFASFL